MNAVELCRRLVGIDTTPGNERAAIELAAGVMDDLGYDDVRIDGHGNLVGRIGPADGPTLVVDGHVDTIPLEPRDWTHDPFGADVVDGRVIGLGTSDMKGPIAAFVAAGGRLAAARPRLRGAVLMVVSTAEEMMEGATLSRSFDDVPVTWCAIAEATGLEVAVAQRGRAKVAVDVRGRSVHAANPGLGVNAVDVAADLVASVRRLPAHAHPTLGGRTVSVIDVHSEPYPSVSTIPDRCLVRFDVRFLPGETPVGLLDAFRDRLPPGAEATVAYHRATWEGYTGEGYAVDEYAAAWETPPDHPLVRAAVEATGGTLGVYRFCTNGSYFAGTRRIPTVGYGPGYAEVAHTADEWIPVEHLERAVDGYEALARRLLA